MKGQNSCTVISAPAWDPGATSNVVAQKWYKPILSIETDSSGDRHVYKAFRFSRGLLGQYFRFLASHEYKMLKKVEHLDFTPGLIRRGSDTLPTINYGLIEGTSIKEIAERNQVPEDFFPRLFADVKTLHGHGVVHMDIGNSGNILVSREGHPAIIDFGSAVPLAWLPHIVRRWARRKDVLGVLKLWYRFDGEAMPPILLRYYQRNYRKNIYTPKRFFKALKKWVTGDGASYDLSGLTTVISLFLGLLVLVSLT